MHVETKNICLLCIFKISIIVLSTYKKQLDCSADDIMEFFPVNTMLFILLSSDGMLVMRPILIGNDFVPAGSKETERASKPGK